MAPSADPSYSTQDLPPLTAAASTVANCDIPEEEPPNEDADAQMAEPGDGEEINNEAPTSRADQTGSKRRKRTSGASTNNKPVHSAAYEAILSEIAPREARLARARTTMATTNPQMALPGTRLCPWSDWSEWLQMRYFLKTKQAIAAQRLLLVFAMRRRPYIPIAMSASVNLLSILTRVHTEMRDVQSCRLGLAMAIIRLVNGMTDAMQPRGADRISLSVATTAYFLRIPSTLVDIRHEATHGELPGLEALVDGARQALRWLDECYWQPQYERLSEIGWFDRRSKPFTKKDLEKVQQQQARAERRAAKGLDPDASSSDEQGRWKGKQTKKSQKKSEKTDEEEVDDETRLLNQISLVIHKKKTRSARMARLRALDRLESERSTVLASKGGIWSECGDEVKWQNTAIGLVINQEQASRVPFEAMLEDSNKEADVSDDDEAREEEDKIEARGHESLPSPALLTTPETNDGGSKKKKKKKKKRKKTNNNNSDNNNSSKKAAASPANASNIAYKLGHRQGEFWLNDAPHDQNALLAPERARLDSLLKM